MGGDHKALCLTQRTAGVIQQQLIIRVMSHTHDTSPRLVTDSITLPAMQIIRHARLPFAISPAPAAAAT